MRAVFARGQEPCSVSRARRRRLLRTPRATTNAFIQAGIAASAIGAALVFTRHLREALMSTFYCSITINNRDKHYPAILEHLSKKCISESTWLVAKTHKQKKTWRQRRQEWFGGLRASGEPGGSLPPACVCVCVCVAHSHARSRRVTDASPLVRLPSGEYRVHDARV